MKTADPIFGLSVGDRVKLLSPHPHAGKYGKVVSFERLVGLGRTGAKVQLSDGNRCFITKPLDFIIK